VVGDAVDNPPNLNLGYYQSIHMYRPILGVGGLGRCYVKTIRPVQCVNSLHTAPFLYTRLRSPYQPQRRKPSVVYGDRDNGQKDGLDNSQYSYAEDDNSGYSYNRFYPSYSVPNPGGVLQPTDAVVDLLSRPTLVVERKLEMMNVFLGFEQANRYTIMDENGGHLGYMEEEDFGITKAILRQVYRLHRPFSVRVLDRQGVHILTIRRPFSFINSHIMALLPGVHEENSMAIGETKQQWHLWRRRYNLFLRASEDNYDQFGRVDAGFLSFEFPVTDRDGTVIGCVDRNWVGLGRELFTDTGVYVIRMDPYSFSGLEERFPSVGGPMTLDQRAVLLGTAVSVDFDYFSRHSNHGGFFSFGDYE
jgi:hypothetical protein